VRHAAFYAIKRVEPLVVVARQRLHRELTARVLVEIRAGAHSPVDQGGAARLAREEASGALGRVRAVLSLQVLVRGVQAVRPVMHRRAARCRGRRVCVATVPE
jgi:hypothetical protein